MKLEYADWKLFMVIKGLTREHDVGLPVDLSIDNWVVTSYYGSVAQWIVCLPRDPMVLGSNPRTT